MTNNIPFIDLQAQRARLGASIDEAIARVLSHGRFIMGPEIDQLEEQLATFVGVDHVVSCSSGTDALLLPLLASGVSRGDAVFVPAFTFAAPAEVGLVLGATPVFVDVLPDTFNMSPQSLQAAIESLGSRLRPAAVVAVDLYGQPAAHRELKAIAAKHGLMLIEDAAQSFGASLDGIKTGALADVASTSFFPAKPLGCYGDGGAVLTQDSKLAERMRLYRNHGQGEGKYNHVAVGLNFRLDTLQAAILLEKLAIFDEEIAARQRVADRYDNGLGNVVTVPGLMPGATSVWAQYTMLVDERGKLIEHLEALGIPTAVHYPKPLTQQPPYVNCPVSPGGVPVSEALSRRVLSLPMHPYLQPDTQDRIIAAVREAVVS